MFVIKLVKIFLKKNYEILPLNFIRNKPRTHKSQQKHLIFSIIMFSKVWNMNIKLIRNKL